MQVLSRLLAAACLALVLALSCLAAHAQSAGSPAPAVTIDKRKLLVQPRNADGTVQQVSILEDPVLWARDLQQRFYGQMSGSLRNMKTGSPLVAGWTLMLLSFGYGIFHAAGPGHGKAVISAWLLATENELRRGIAISAMSAVIQALTAIVIVSALLLLVASASARARDVAGVLESASYALIGAMGLYLVWTAFRIGRPKAQPAHPARDAAQRRSDLHHFDSFQPLQNGAVAHDHVHGPDCGCGHAHLPEARDLRGDWSLARAFSLAFAVGIRPCTGALLVLIFANALGLYWAGIAATFAMALGTFITVSTIAAIAVYSKKLATRYARQDDRWISWLNFGLRLGGGLAIAFFGAILFLGSLGSTNGMM
jgi:ABC-type nickel/cobalt efflux system permease component RcnA